MKEDIIDKYDQEWLWIVLRLTQSKGNLYDAITPLHTENDIFSLLDHLQRLRYLFFDGEIGIAAQKTHFYNESISS